MFLPFSVAGKAIELKAVRVKERLGLHPSDALDPYAVLSRVPARLVDPAIFADAPAVRRLLFQTHTETWSAIGLMRSPATGEELILLNPTHHRHRQRVSLMEEIVHVILDHPRTELTFAQGNGAWVRHFQASVEDEAYCVGAACILPWPELFAAVSGDGEHVSTIAERYQVSTQYVQYRIRKAGLSRVYEARQRTRAAG